MRLPYMSRSSSLLLASLGCALMAGLTSIARGQDVTTGLVTNYRFDGNVTDSVTGTALTALGGTTRYSADRFGVAGRALEFLTAPSDSIFLRGTGPSLANQSSSVAFWIKKNGQSPGWIFSLSADGVAGAPGNAMHVAISEGAFVRYSFFFDDFDTSFVPVVGVWYHFAFTYDQTTRTRRFYRNGTLVSSNQAAFGFSGGNTLKLSPTNLTLDDFRFYNRALTAQDVAALAATPAAFDPPNVPPFSSTRNIVTLGQSFTLQATASGTPPLSYQWLRNGMPIAGATSPTVTITGSLPYRDTGWYQLVVTSPAGSTTGAGAFLNVVSPAQVRVWGDSSAGQQAVPTLGAIAALTGGSAHLLAVKSDGTVAAWGYSQNGETAVPAGLRNVVAVAADGHSLALRSDGTVVGWGYNANGQANPPAGLRDVVAVAAGGETSLALKSDGTVLAWGRNATSTLAVPFSLTGVVGIAMGGLHALALRADGTVVAWGSNSLGQATVPSGLSGVVAIAAGSNHSVALKADGTVVTFGNVSATVPAGLNGVVAIDAAGGGEFTMALKSDGSVVAWGNLAGGVLTVPSGLNRVVGIAAGGNFAAAASTDPTPPTITSDPVDQTVVAGEVITLSVGYSGSPPVAFQWSKNGVPITGATNATLTISDASVSDAGTYRVVISNPVGGVTSAGATVTVKSLNPGRLSNLSIRTASSAGNGTLIVGFVLGGAGTSGTTPLLTRAGGPALQQFGVAGTLPDPQLSLYDGARLIASNDNWNGSDVSASAAAVGAFAFAPASKDAAINSALSGSSYTAQVLDVGGATGVALVELYDASPAFSYTRPRLINISARATAGSGDGTMIAGFVVKGETPVTVLIRGIGPSLSQFGVTGALANPRLTLLRDTTLITVNDNWGDLSAATIAATAASVGAFALPANSLDSAILATLQPGSYTVQVSGANNAPGIALIEVYVVP